MLILQEPARYFCNSKQTIMKSIFFFLIATMVSCQILAQPATQKQDTSWKKNYRESSPKINDLIHTKLELKPDYSKSYLYGKAWITLKPHFYATDSLTLDAKGMEFHKIAVVNGSQQKELKYTYNDLQVRIQLDKTYNASQD